MFRTYGHHADSPYLFSMASSSHTPAQTTTVILTSGDDRRTLTLRPSESVGIGRASKSDCKNLQAAPNNALYDCPVVSRLHAQLKYSPWEPQITITDHKSLHGTTVNGEKLTPGVDCVLKSGDVIKLGLSVTRGDDIHDGLSLTFQHIENAPQAGPRSPSPVTRGFHVPSPSEAGSDDESDVESVYSIHHDESSSKTTPEQPKHFPVGSQQAPINLDPVPVHRSQPTVNTSYPKITAAPSAARYAMAIPPRSIPGSFDEQDDGPPSAPQSAEETSLSLIDDAFDAVEDESDAESFHGRNTGLSQILNEGDLHSIDARDVDEYASHDDEYEYDDGQEAAESLADDVDGLSDSAASDIDVDTTESQPTLPPATQSINLPDSQPSSNDTEDPALVRKPQDNPRSHAAQPPKPRYDPVRSSQMPAEYKERFADLPSYVSGPSGSYHSLFGYGIPVSNSTASFASSSCWDAPPPDSAGTGRYNFAMKPTNNDYTIPGQLSYGSDPSFETAPTASSRPYSHCLFSSSETSQPAKEASKAPHKISIPDIVDEPSSTIAKEVELVKDAAILSSAPVAVKRKTADPEAEEYPTQEPPAKKQKSGFVNVVTDRPVARPRGLRRHAAYGMVRRCRRIARTAAAAVFSRTTAALSTGAILGVTGTVTFLSSPAAQSLIDWLN